MKRLPKRLKLVLRRPLTVKVTPVEVATLVMVAAILIWSLGLLNGLPEGLVICTVGGVGTTTGAL